MLHWVCSTIEHGEHGLSELPKKSHSHNFARERWSGNLVERSAYRIISQAFGREVLVSVLMVVVLLIRERLTRRSLWSGSITAILLIIRKEVRIGGSSSPPFVAQLPLQVINLQLHGFGIFLMRKVTPASRLALASMGGMHSNLPVLFVFEINEMIFTLGPNRFLQIRTWTYHSWT